MGALIGAAVLLRAPAAQAEGGPGIALEWEAPAECPSEQDAISKVEYLLGASLESLPAQQLRFEARISKTSASVPTYGIELRVSSEEESSERRFEDTSCVLLMEAAALVVALAIDPEKVEARQRVLESEPGTAGGSAPSPEGASAVAAAPLPVVEERRPGGQERNPSPRTPPRANPDSTRATPMDRDATRRGALLRLGARFEAAVPMLLGVAGSAVVGIEGGLGAILGDAWYFLGTGQYWFLGTETVPKNPAARLELNGVGGAARLCFTPGRSGWGIEACAGASAISISAKGAGFEPTRRTRGWWWGPHAEVAWAMPFTKALGIRGALFGGPALSRPRFGVSEATGRLVVVEPERWFAGATLGVLYVLDRPP